MWSIWFLLELYALSHLWRLAVFVLLGWVASLVPQLFVAVCCGPWASVGESVMISYATSELTTVFLSQPISIIISYFAYKLIGKYGQYLPACLQRLVKQSSKNNIPPVYFFSNPWASTAESAFTSKFAYSLFVRCPALASNTNELAYAPTKAIAHDIETMPPPCKVEELYRTTMEIKEDLRLRTVAPIFH